MKRGVQIFLVLCMTIMFFPASANANDAMVVGGTGGTVYAISNSQVEMEEEIIDIVVKDGRTYVSCQFFFHNTGERTKLMMGFPTKRPNEYYMTHQDLNETNEYEDDDEPNDVLSTRLNWFRTFVCGKRVPVSVKSGLEPEGNNTDDLYFPQWYTWNVSFAADERVKVVNKYWSINSGGVGNDWEAVEYILRSGTTWKGTIGKVTVRMKFEGYFESEINFQDMQPTYIEEDGTIVWEAENIEPEEDIAVYSEIYTYENDAWDTPFDYEDPRIDEYRRMQERMLRNFDAGYYNGTTWWGNKLLKEFGDTQSNLFYFAMGTSYFKLGIYDKALDMLRQAEYERIWSNTDKNDVYFQGVYYRAKAAKKLGYAAEYSECIQELARCGHEWLALWAKSRLHDMEPALDNGVMLEDIAALLNMSGEALQQTYGDQLEWHRYDYTYFEYAFEDMGINIVCQSDDHMRDSSVKYIELDRDQISFHGINTAMNFEEVMRVLGKTDIIVLEDGLPGLYTYELRYQFDGIKVRIYSYDKEGSGGVYMSVVDDYIREYRPICITPEQISHYFDLTQKELIEEIGEGTPWPNDRWLYYEQYGVSFRFDDQKETLYAIQLDSNYQIEELKSGITLEDAMKIRGKRRIEEWETSEDGTMFEIVYLFRNFRLKISALESEGPFGYWDILGEHFEGGNRYS